MAKQTSVQTTKSSSVPLKVCTRCKETKPTTEFYPVKKKKAGAVTSRCKACTLTVHYAYAKTPNGKKANARSLRKWHQGKGKLRSRELCKRFKKKHWLTHLVGLARNRATQKGLLFSLDAKWIEANREQRVCPVTGLQFNIGTGRTTAGLPDPLAPSIDRRVPALGYVPGNVQIISWWANIAKNALSEDQFRMMISASASNLFH